MLGNRVKKNFKQLHKRYGFAGLFVSRFLPGVRAIVPPFAGAMELPAFKVLLSVASASAVWFAFITFLAFRAGDNWDVVQHYLVRSGKVAGAGLDHFEGEHLATDHPLTSMANVVLTPHIGGATFDTEVNHSRLIADDLARLLAGERPLHCVNPEVLR